jgi:nucleoside-diphosphate-sugar epimerase
MNILIVGSSGFIGRVLLERMKKSRHQVVALYKSKHIEPSRNVFPASVDFNNSENIRTVLRNIEVVVYLAWEYSHYFDQRIRIKESSNLDSLKSLLPILEEQEIRRIIFTSSLHAKEGVSNPFLADKYNSECLILNSSIKEKIIMKSDVIWGEREDYFLEGLRQLIKFPIYPTFPDKGPIYPVNVNDFIDQLFLNIENPIEWSCNIRYCLGQESVTVNDVLNLLKKSLDLNFKVPVRGVLSKYYLDFLKSVSRSGISDQFVSWYNAYSQLNIKHSHEKYERIKQKYFLLDAIKGRC